MIFPKTWVFKAFPSTAMYGCMSKKLHCWTLTYKIWVSWPWTIPTNVDSWWLSSHEPGPTVSPPFTFTSPQNNEVLQQIISPHEPQWTTTMMKNHHWGPSWTTNHHHSYHGGSISIIAVCWLLFAKTQHLLPVDHCPVPRFGWAPQAVVFPRGQLRHFRLAPTAVTTVLDGGPRELLPWDPFAGCGCCSHGVMCKATVGLQRSGRKSLHAHSNFKSGNRSVMALESRLALQDSYPLLSTCDDCIVCPFYFNADHSC